MPDQRPAKSPTPVLFVLLLAGVSFALSQTLVVPALPAISREFGASATATSWVLTGFLLSASVATPIVGKLGDLLGKGRVGASQVESFFLLWRGQSFPRQSGAFDPSPLTQPSLTFARATGCSI